MSQPSEEFHQFRGWPYYRGLDPRTMSAYEPNTVPLGSWHYQGRRPTVGETTLSGKNDNRSTEAQRRRVDGQEKVEDNEKKPSFLEYLFSTTGFQGPTKIWEAPYKPLKVLWLLAFLGACVVMVIQLEELFREFFSYPTKTQVKLEFSPLPLPALTLCNVNPVRRTFAKNLSCTLQHYLKVPEADMNPDCEGKSYDQYDLNFTDSYCWGCDYYDDYGDTYTLEDLDDFTVRRENIALYMGDETRAMRNYVGHQLEDLVVTCSLFGWSCPFRNLTSFLSREYGNCYTFSAPKILSTKSGPGSALVLTLNLETEEFLESYKTGYGVRVVLHENGTRPFPSTEGFTISSGTETDIAIRLTKIKRKGGKYGSCDEGDVVEAISGFKYTIANCRDQCLHKTMVDRCKCVPLSDEGHRAGLTSGSDLFKFCSTNKEYDCTKKVYGDYVNTTRTLGTDLCQCENPCEETIYTPTLSTRQWPILSHVPVLEEQVCKLNPQSPKCFYLGASFNVNNVDIRRGFVRIRLYYERLNYEFVEEQPFYDTERFLSDIGGTLGLWIGVTVLGLVELFELGLLAVSKVCNRLRSSRSSSAQR